MIARGREGQWLSRDGDGAVDHDRVVQLVCDRRRDRKRTLLRVGMVALNEEGAVEVYDTGVGRHQGWCCWATVAPVDGCNVVVAAEIARIWFATGRIGESCHSDVG